MDVHIVQAVTGTSQVVEPTLSLYNNGTIQDQVSGPDDTVCGIQGVKVWRLVLLKFLRVREKILYQPILKVNWNFANDKIIQNLLWWKYQVPNT